MFMHGFRDNPDSFCTTGDNGMVMLMNGFRIVLKGGCPCINLFFPGWTLNTPYKFVGAMVGVFILALITELFGKFRTKALHLSTTTKTTQIMKKKLFRYVYLGMHGVHAIRGYFLMLAAMTYSVELFICVISGLVLGHALFATTGGDGDENGIASTSTAKKESRVSAVVDDAVSEFLEGKSRIFVAGEPLTDNTSSTDEKEAVRRCHSGMDAC